MNMLLVLIPAALLLGLVGLGAFGRRLWIGLRRFVLSSSGLFILVLAAPEQVAE